jgi:peptidoglycan-N-acetylglucosamine deacetylase
MKYCCVSVDVDGIEQYFRIHGLPQVDLKTSGLAHGLALERLKTWAREAQIPLTWFVIGKDTARPDFIDLVKDALSMGHELANHSMDHLYNLARLDADAQTAQVLGAQERFETMFGVRPVGFRAPGYTVSDALLDIVERAGIIYDSSVFPCPAYHAAKAAILLGQRLLGRNSASILDSPRVLTAPRRPYRRDKSYTRVGKGLLEIPIQVTRWGRLPFIGTTLTLLGPSGAGLMARSLVGEELVNLELHAIDFLTADDNLHDLARHQPDLRVPLTRKLAALSAVSDVFRTANYQFATMAEAVRRLDF